MWFDGSITAAINGAKVKSKVILILVTEDEESSELTSLWQDQGLQALCTQECVCLKLTASSDPGKQFSQIYPVILVPSTFLIGNDGKPIHVLPGVIEVQDLTAKIQDAITKNKPVPSSSPQVGNSDTGSSSSTTPQSPEGKQRKQEEYLEKMNQLRLKKLQEEQEKEKKAELERRKLGRNMASFADEQRNRQMLESIAERKRDKVLEKKAREDVLRKIKEDRANMKKKYDAQAATSAAEKPLPTQPSTRTKQVFNNICLQYRFMNGTSMVRTYELDATLGDAVTDLRQEAASKLPANFQLSIAFSKIVFTENDYGKTLSDLDLAPRCSLQVKPVKAAVSTFTGGSHSNVLQFGLDICLLVLALPVKFIRVVFGLLFGSNNTAATSNTETARLENSAMGDTSPSTSQPSNSPSVSAGLRRRYPEERGGKSNVHRLHDDKGSDDDNATWNGNSTQQM